MAITIHSQPTNWQNAGNPLTYVFSSNQTAQANFSYIIQTKVNGSTVSVDRLFPEVGARSHWDISEIVQRAIEPSDLSTALYENSGRVVNIQITIIENYGTPPSNQASMNSMIVPTFNCTLSDYEWVNTDFFNDWRLQRWFTDAPNNTLIVNRGCDIPSSMLIEDEFIIYITTYDSSGNQIDYVEVQELFDDLRIVDFNFNKTNMENAGVADLDAVAYFTVQIETSDILTVRFVEDDCAQPYTLLWLNKYGYFDAWAITHNLRRNTEVTEFSYTKQFGQWEGTSFEYNPYDSGQKQYLKVMNDKGVMSTGYMSEAENAFFVQLFDSTRHYLYNASGLMYPIVVTNRNYEFFQDRFDDLISQDVQFNINVNRRSIRE